jgi:hypothetical protein
MPGVLVESDRLPRRGFGFRESLLVMQQTREQIQRCGIFCRT